MTDTWVEVPDGSPFTIDNLPYGVFSTSSHGPRVGVAIGDHVLDAAPFFGVRLECGLRGTHGRRGVT